MTVLILPTYSVPTLLIIFISSSVQLNSVNTPPNWDSLRDFINSKLLPTSSFVIPPITTSFVLNSLQHLSAKKAVGLDGLSGYCLKVSAPSICSSLTSIFNLSISSNSFPDSWKIAKVSPLFKALILTLLTIDLFQFSL